MTGPILHATFTSEDMTKPDAPTLVYFRQKSQNAGEAKWSRADHDAGSPPGTLTGYTGDKAVVFTLPPGDFLPDTVEAAMDLPGAQPFVVPIDVEPVIPNFFVSGPGVEYHLYVGATDEPL